MNRRKSKFIIYFAVFFLFVACQEQSSTQIPVGNALNENSGVGTVVSLPHPTKQLETSLTLKSISDDDIWKIDFFEEQSFCGSLSRFLGFSYCAIEPSHYQFGIRAMDLVSCRDRDGKIGPCIGDHMITDQFNLFSQDQTVSITIDSEKVKFPDPLKTVDRNFEASGLKLSLSYIEVTLPEDPLYGAQVEHSWEGTVFRRCGLDAAQVSQEQMQFDCGHIQAQKGDYLVKRPQDSNFGFLVWTDKGADILADRPVNYETTILSKFLENKFGFHDIYGFVSMKEQAHFSPVYSLIQPIIFDQDKGHSLHLDLLSSYMLRFLENSNIIFGQGKTICSQGAEGLACQNPDSKTEADPTYDPIQDGFPVVTLPKAKLSLE